MGQKRPKCSAAKVRSLSRWRSRQYHPDFSEPPRHRVNLDRAAMLLDNDVVTDREPKPRALSGRLRREKWIEHLLPHVRRNTVAVVANPNFHAVTEALRRGNEGWLVVAPFRLRMALRRRVKAI